MQNQSKLDAAQITESIRLNIQQAAQWYDAYQAVLSVLQERPGQEITKRIATAIKKASGGKYIVDYDTAYGMFHVTLHGNGVSYDDRIRLLVGYASNPYIDVALFQENCAGIIATYEDSEKLKALLSHPEVLTKAVEDWNQYLAELKGIYAWANDFYGFGFSRYFVLPERWLW